jgi:hypothetical protein
MRDGAHLTGRGALQQDPRHPSAERGELVAGARCAGAARRRAARRGRARGPAACRTGPAARRPARLRASAAARAAPDAGAPIPDVAAAGRSCAARASRATAAALAAACQHQRAPITREGAGRRAHDRSPRLGFRPRNAAGSVGAGHPPRTSTGTLRGPTPGYDPAERAPEPNGSRSARPPGPDPRRVDDPLRAPSCARISLFTDLANLPLRPPP